MSAQPGFTLCLVTDRRRLGQALGAPPETWTRLVVMQARAAARGGADLICVRERDLDGGRLIRLVRDVAAAVRGHDTSVVVNDRLDVALAAPVEGVHLREASFGPAEVRKVSATLLCGCSIHDMDGVRRRPGAAYFLAGTVRATPSKVGSTCLGWDRLAAIVRATDVPVLGIGGLTETDVPALVAAGASGLAAVGAFIPIRLTDLESFVQERAERIRKRFDSLRGVS